MVKIYDKIYREVSWKCRLGDKAGKQWSFVSKREHFEPEGDEEIALAIYQIGRSRYTKLGKLTKRKILYSQGPSAARWPLLTSV